MGVYRTTHHYPPSPARKFDWSAREDGEENGPVGWGYTEAAALVDLMGLLDADIAEKSERMWGLHLHGIAAGGSNGDAT